MISEYSGTNFKGKPQTAKGRGRKKTSDGKKKRAKCLYLCPTRELPPTPEHGTKWHVNLQDLLLDWESKRLIMEKDHNFCTVQQELSTLVQKLANQQQLPRVPQKEIREKTTRKSLLLNNLMPRNQKLLIYPPC
jgi:hypothetical protein